MKKTFSFAIAMFALTAIITGQDSTRNTDGVPQTRPADTSSATSSSQYTFEMKYRPGHKYRISSKTTIEQSASPKDGQVKTVTDVFETLYYLDCQQSGQNPLPSLKMTVGRFAMKYGNSGRELDSDIPQSLSGGMGRDIRALTELIFTITFDKSGEINIDGIGEMFDRANPGQSNASEKNRCLEEIAKELKPFVLSPVWPGKSAFEDIGQTCRIAATRPFTHYMRMKSLAYDKENLVLKLVSISNSPAGKIAVIKLDGTIETNKKTVKQSGQIKYNLDGQLTESISIETRVEYGDGSKDNAKTEIAIALVKEIPTASSHPSPTTATCTTRSTTTATTSSTSQTSRQESEKFCEKIRQALLANDMAFINRHFNMTAFLDKVCIGYNPKNKVHADYRNGFFTDCATGFLAVFNQKCLNVKIVSYEHRQETRATYRLIDNTSFKGTYFTLIISNENGKFEIVDYIMSSLDIPTSRILQTPWLAVTAMDSNGKCLPNQPQLINELVDALPKAIETMPLMASNPRKAYETFHSFPVSIRRLPFFSIFELAAARKVGGTFCISAMEDLDKVLKDKQTQWILLDYYIDHNPEKAVKVTDAVYNELKDPYILISKSFALVAIGKYQEANAVYKKALAMEDDNFAIYLSAAALGSLTKDYKSTIESLKIIQTKFPTWTLTLANDQNYSNFLMSPEYRAYAEEKLNAMTDYQPVTDWEAFLHVMTTPAENSKKLTVDEIRNASSHPASADTKLMAFCKTLETVMSGVGTAKFVDANFDFEQFLAESCTLFDPKNPAHVNFKKEQLESLKKDGLAEILFSNDGQDYQAKILQFVESNGKGRCLIRLSQNGEAYYYDFYVFQAAEKPMIADIYSYQAGVCLSYDTKNAWLFCLLFDPDGKIPAKASRFFKNAATAYLGLNTATAMKKNGDADAAMKFYDTLPDMIKTTYLFINTVGLPCSETLGGKAYIDFLESLATYYDKKERHLYAFLKRYYDAKLYDQCLAILDDMEKHTGPDGYMADLKSIILNSAGRTENARTEMARALAAEPEVISFHFALISIDLKTKNYKAITQELTNMENKFKVDVEEMLKHPDWNDFKNSKEYKEWTTTRTPTSQPTSQKSDL